MSEANVRRGGYGSPEAGLGESSQKPHEDGKSHTRSSFVTRPVATHSAT